MPRRGDEAAAQHAQTLSSVPGNYRHFLDELFRLNLIDQEQRNYLLKGLHEVAGKGVLIERALVPPCSTHLACSDALERRARKSGLVREEGRDRYRVLAGPETIHWGLSVGCC